MKQPNIKAPKCTLFFRVKGHKGSPVLPRLLPSIAMGSLLRRAHFESFRAAEAKNAATINQLKYRSRSCITGNIALGAWSRANKALGCTSCFIGSRPRPRAIFPVMHSHGTLTSIHERGCFISFLFVSVLVVSPSLGVCCLSLSYSLHYDDSLFIMECLIFQASGVIVWSVGVCCELG